jgi:hypothetical protein
VVGVARNETTNNKKEEPKATIFLHTASFVEDNISTGVLVRFDLAMVHRDWAANIVS